MTFRLATQSKGEVCIDASHSLSNGRPKFLPGRSRRVSFVANLILFNVNQSNPKPMTMPICSLDHCCVPPVYVIHFLHHVVHSRYSDSGSLNRGSLRGVSIGVDRGIWSTKLCLHTVKRYIPWVDRGPFVASLIGHQPSDRRHY